MNHETPYRLIGIDGGGTGCRVAIATPDGKIVARAEGGPANYASDPDGTITNIRNAVDRAVRDSGLSDDTLAQCIVHAGLAGVQRQADATKVVDALPFRRCIVTEDRVTAMAGALGDDDGVLVSVGTGAFVGVKRGNNARFFGGWGLQVSDQGSGAWLGRMLLETVLLVHDGVLDPSDLVKEVLHEFASDPTRIVAFAAEAAPADYAAFAPRIVEAAQNGDVHAERLMQEGKNHLERCVRIGLSAVDMKICFSGGIGQYYVRLFDTDFQMRIVQPQGTALDGALRLARKSFLENVSAS